MKNSKQSHKTKVSKQKSNSTTYQKISDYLDKMNKNKLLLFFLLIGLFFDFINFNARISEAHDDALYIEAAYHFVNEFPNYFYTANAPFYAMFLAVVYKLFGFKLLLFKLLNVLFHILTIYFFFQALKNKLPILVLIPVMFFLSVNHHIVYFSSMTFTESIFMFLQSWMIYTLVRWYDNYSSQSHLFTHIKQLWAFVLVCFFMMITRSGAIVILPSFLLFSWFILKDKKLSFGFILSYLFIFLPYKLLLKIIFGNISQYSNQSKILLQKDPYDASLGQEDLTGFVQRFFDNSNLYLSKRFFQIMGWMSEMNTNTYGFLALVMWALFLIAIWKFFKQKQYHLLFISLYSLFLILLSFVILQARWDQPRIIMVAMPVMLIAYFYLVFSFKSNFIKNIGLILTSVFIVSMIISTTKRGIKNIPIVLKNLQGDIYYGYTPDWLNFLKASEWCGNNLPPNAYVASRKSPMSFIYGKRKFFPIYSVIKKDPETNQSNPDSALAFFKQNGVTHILLPNLRIDPNKNTGQVINTIHNILEPISKKYPQKLKCIHTEGETEPCYIYEFKYE